MADAATMLEARQPRRFPIDAAKVIGPVTTETDLKLTLPAGWRVRLPPSVDVSDKWGNYQAHYQQSGDTLSVHRRLEGARGVYPPASLSDLAAWLRAVAQDDVSYLVIEPSVTP
jgi:hypothetical protein